MAVVASFTANKLIDLVPPNETVQFTDTSTGSPDKWLWDFGDGEFSTSQNPSHAFIGETGDIFTVTLTVWIADSDTTVNEGSTTNETRQSGFEVDNATAFATWLATSWGSNVNKGADLLNQNGGGAGYNYIGARWIKTAANISAMDSVDVAILLELQRFTVSDLNPSFIISTQSGTCAVNVDGAASTFSGIGGTGVWIPAVDISHLAGAGAFNWDIRPQETLLPEVASSTYGGFHIEARFRKYIATSEDNIDSAERQVAFMQNGIVDFVGTPLSGTSPLAVQFTDLSTVSHVLSVWDFGDGNSVTFAGETHPLNTYTTDQCSIDLL
jgi:hypothetical protein